MADNSLIREAFEKSVASPAAKGAQIRNAASIVNQFLVVREALLVSGKATGDIDALAAQLTVGIWNRKE